MARRLALLVALAGLAGCKRDLEVPPRPSVEKLGILPVFQSAAPRESIQFAAAGGAGGYLFAFAQGGNLSGTDASIDPDGLYTAGSTGSAQDLIEVTDATGATATATVSVGQRLVVTPSFTGTAPGGQITFAATGGQPDYVFSMIQDASGGGITTDGVYSAGPVGDQVDTILVTDHYGATAKAAVQVSSALHLYRSETRPVAPHESVTFIAFGGQPPYTFSIGTARSGYPTIDSTSGVYTAGDRPDPDPVGIVTDVVTVADSARTPQVANIDVPVGARLALQLDAAEVHPGQTAQLVATGGKPPYTFGFAARMPPEEDPFRENGGNGGNRSRGTVNAFTGEYVPGFSPQAIDFFQVTDTTGAPAAIVAGPPVGGVPFAIGSGTRGCIAADLNGDRSEDVAFFIGGDNIHKMTTVEVMDTPEPFLQSYYLSRDPTATSLAYDFAGTGRDQIAFFGGDQHCSGSGFCPASDVWAAVPDLAGFVSVSQVLGGGSQQTVNVLNDPAYQNGSGTAYHRVTTNYGIRHATGLYDAAASTWRFYADGWDADTIQTSYWSPGPDVCWDPAGSWTADRWMIRVDWPVGAEHPSAPACVRAKNLCPTCDGTSYYGPLAMAVGDYDGDGRTDLAWILSTDNNSWTAKGSGGAKLYISYGIDPTGATTIFPAAGQHSGWPGSTWWFEQRDSSTQTRFMTVRPPGSTHDALLVRLVDSSTGRARLFLVADPQALGGWNASLEPAGGVDGVAAYRPAPGADTSYLCWSGNDGAVSGFGLDPSLVFTAVSTVATLPFAVNAVCLPDVNADGTPDLVAASDTGATAELLLGDGTTGASGNGSFAARAHLRGATFPVAVGDLDGDGFGDAVVAGAGSGVHVLWGGGGMLAWGPQISPASISAAAVAQFTADPWPSILFQEKSGRFGLVRSRHDGTFDPAVAITGVSAAGGAPGSYFYVWPADLGTSNPGHDLLTFENGNGGITYFHALLFQGSEIVDVRSKPIPSADANHVSTRDCWAMSVGTHQPAVAAMCSYENRASGGNVDLVAVWGANLVRVDAGPDPGGGGPAFGDWVLLTPTTAPWSQPSANRVRAAQIGNVAVPNGAGGTDAGTALFLMNTDELYAVEVKSIVPGTVPRAFAVTPTTKASPFLGTYGQMDATSAFHVVASGDDGTIVLRRTATEYRFVQQLGAQAFPLGIAPLSKLPSGGRSPGDVLTFLGDFSNTGLTPEIIPLLNDGTGKVK